nr:MULTISPECIES: hypothetical protein [Rhizobium/Agrobacterium group]
MVVTAIIHWNTIYRPCHRGLVSRRAACARSSAVEPVTANLGARKSHR